LRTNKSLIPLSTVAVTFLIPFVASTTTEVNRFSSPSRTKECL
jgi:hypothetical protein